MARTGLKIKMVKGYQESILVKAFPYIGTVIAWARRCRARWRILWPGDGLSEWVQLAEEWVRVERTGSSPPSLPSPATCAPHLRPPTCHLAFHLHCNCTALHAHTALTSDMTCPAQLLHTRCHIRKGEAKKVWVDAALCGRPTFPRQLQPADHQLSAGAARVPSETFWRTPNPQSWWVLQFWLLAIFAFETDLSQWNSFLHYYCLISSSLSKISAVTPKRNF